MQVQLRHYTVPLATTRLEVYGYRSSTPQSYRHAAGASAGEKEPSDADMRSVGSGSDRVGWMEVVRRVVVSHRVDRVIGCS